YFNKIFPIAFLIFFLTSFISCRNTGGSSIPSAPVFIKYNLSVHNTVLRAPLDYVTFEKRNDLEGIYNIGYGGVLVNMDMNGKLCAFDMTCPRENDKEVKVQPDDTGAYAVCENCGSKFDLVYGYGQVSQGPSKDNLKRYNAYIGNENGVQILVVKN
ncbi:hypothetical protein LJB95_02725, partial [Paludibacteraceae bacterium OttesenSCG-928-F17]|nr:hypothetical protein [Paludibacteraceae bacterium OttesenSCG-928-F17]